MTIPEQVGKVATNTIDALKSSPGLLSILLLQLVTLAVLTYIAQANQARAHEREMFLMKECFPNYDKTGAVP